MNLPNPYMKCTTIHFDYGFYMKYIPVLLHSDSISDSNTISQKHWFSIEAIPVQPYLDEPEHIQPVTLLRSIGPRCGYRERYCQSTPECHTAKLAGDSNQNHHQCDSLHCQSMAGIKLQNTWSSDMQRKNQIPCSLIHCHSDRATQLTVLLTWLILKPIKHH